MQAVPGPGKTAATDGMKEAGASAKRAEADGMKRQAFLQSRRRQAAADKKRDLWKERRDYGR